MLISSLIQNKIPLSTYLDNPFQIAKETLLGAYLCTNINNELTIGKITELEVYMGAIDKAAHTYNNRRTPRVESCYKQGGCAYVFFIYGKHFHFNVVIAEKNDPKAILIRSIEPVYGLETMIRRRNNANLKTLTNGPGKLCQALGITKEYDGIDLTGNIVWLSPKTEVLHASQIEATPRIGIDYAQEYTLKHWRFLIKKTK